MNYNLRVKDQTLDVAYKLKDLLKTSYATVYMTRDGDRGNPNRLNLKDSGDDAFLEEQPSPKQL